MIKQANELKQSIVHNLRGGIGDITRIDLFSGDEMLNKAISCAVLLLPKGASIGEHSHSPDAEIYYILSGNLRVTDDNITKDLHEGDVVFTGDGATHSVVNLSEKDATLLSIIIS